MTDSSLCGTELRQIDDDDDDDDELLNVSAKRLVINHAHSTIHQIHIDTQCSSNSI